jgi:hypothetical protein
MNKKLLRAAKGILSAALVMCFVKGKAHAQSTIVIAKKAQSEISPGVNFGFTSTIPAGSSFTLNDDPSFITMQDVGMGANNTVWAIAAPASSPGNGQVYYRPAGTTSWIAAPGAGTRIDVYNNGTTILVNAQGYMFIWTGSAFTATTATSIAALDIGISAGTVQSAYLLAGAGAAPGCQALWRWDGGGNYTGYANICGTRLDVAPDGTVYVLDESTATVKHVSISGGIATITETIPAPNMADITVAADGSVWAFGLNLCYRLSGTTWILDPNSTGSSAGPNYAGISAGSDGDTPIITANSKAGNALGTRGRLIQRREDGGWMNDHTVRSSGTGNSVIYNVAPGTYTITENPTSSSWDLIKINTAGGSVTTDIPSRTATVTIAAGETVHLEYVNYNIQSSVISNSCGTPYVETFGASGSGALSFAPTIYSPYHYNEIGAETYNLINNFQPLYYNTPGLDHTPGDTGGYFLNVNGGYGQDEVFRRRFSGLLPGAVYSLSLWATNITTGTGYVIPNLVFETRNLSGGLISSAFTGNIPFTSQNDWRQYSMAFTADASGTVDFIIRNNQQIAGVAGNDFAIDDITIGVGCDYGDAPDSYGTTITGNGPSHKVTDLLKLGATIDSNTDGIPTTDTKGDDDNGSSDEDGIASFPSISGGSSTTVTNYAVNVVVTNAIGTTANLCGWIDWNNNGTFDASEGVCTTVANNATTATLVWPTGSLAGPTGTTGVYARFRITTDVLTSGNSIGAAADGEVEDYFIPFEAPLPVTLVSFTAVKSEQVVVLNWTTTTETNSDHFEIQRSLDGKAWLALGNVNAKGESTVKQIYSYTDRQPEMPGEILYRLKMIDHDGTFTYSRMITVKFDGIELSAYPNPANDRVLVKNYSQVKKVAFYNTSGRLVFHAKEVSAQGIDVSKLSPGIYTIIFTQLNGTISTHKVAVTK